MFGPHSQLHFLADVAHQIAKAFGRVVTAAPCCSLGITSTSRDSSVTSVTASATFGRSSFSFSARFVAYATTFWPI